MASMNNKNGRNGGGNTTLGFTLNPGIQPTGEGNPPSTGAFMGHTDSSQWTVLVDASEDQDHPGMRKPTGFFQPIRHLSGERTLFFILTTTKWVGACKKKKDSRQKMVIIHDDIIIICVVRPFHPCHEVIKLVSRSNVVHYTNIKCQLPLCVCICTCRS